MAKHTGTMVKLTEAKGTHFVGVRKYRNQQGELSNQTILVGFSYANAKETDLKTLKAADPVAVAEAVGYPVDLVQVVFAELEKSLVSPEKARSEGQTNAYETVSNGVRRHVETGDLYLTGLRVTKKVLEKGEYKTVNSSDKTLCKNKVKKHLGFRTDQFVNFKLTGGQYAIRGAVVS